MNIVDRNIEPEHIIENIPGIIWIKDLDLRYVACNESLRRFAGFPSKNDIIKHDDYNLPWANYAEAYREGDRQILQGKSLSFIHPMRLYNGKEVIILTKKSPFYDTAKNLLGVIGFISIITAPDIIQPINYFKKLDKEIIGLKKINSIQYIISENLENFNLTKKENACLFYLVRGKSAREISETLFISRRTVEKHIENIKHKLQCKSKSEIIGKAIDHGFIHFIPSEFLINRFQKN